MRRRPLFYAAVFISLGIFFQHHLLAPFRLIAALLAIDALAFGLLFRQKRIAAVCACVWLSLFGAFVLAWADHAPPNDILWKVKSAKGPVYLGGRIVSDVETKKTFHGDALSSFTLESKKMWPDEDAPAENTSGRTLVFLKNSARYPSYGDEIVMKGELAAPQGRRNPGGFDFREFLRIQGVRTVFYGENNFSPKILPRNKGNYLFKKILEIKHFLSEGLSSEFEKNEAGFLKALFFGERSDMEQEFKDLFLKTGTMHILAVSGFNIGFLGLAIFLLFKPLPLSRDLKLWLTAAAIWFYCVLVGWQAPAVRAATMATVVIAGSLLGRKSDFLNTLGLSAVIILLIYPRQLFDIGFQLSFLSVFAIASFVPAFVERPKLLPNELPTLREKIVQYGRELFWVSFVCFAVTLPLTVQSFYIVTPLSLAANMIVVPLSLALFLSGVLYLLTFWWMPKFLGFVPFLMKLVLGIFVQSLNFIENIPGAYFVVGTMPQILSGILTAGLFYLLWDKRIQNRAARAALVMLFLCQIFLALEISRHFGRPFKMTALDVGQGDAIYFEFPKGGNLLMDAGKGMGSDEGRWVVAPFLKYKGVRSIDAMVISHPQEDHIGGMLTVLDEFNVKNVIEAEKPYPSSLYKKLKMKIAAEKSAHSKVYAPMRIDGFPDVKINVLNPSKEKTFHQNINDDSVVLKITYGETEFLLTGDIQEPAMKDMLERGEKIKSVVLKVPHHGAQLTAVGKAFVNRVRPEISVISVGEHNPFGHPSALTLKVLSSIPGNEIYRTDVNGAVEIISDGRNVRADPYSILDIKK